MERKKFPRAHHMTPEELAGQVLMPAVDLNYFNRHAPKARQLYRLIHRFGVGGIIFFHGHPADLRAWTTLLQRESRYPLLFGADMERGLGSVFAHGTLFPHALAFGAAGDEGLVHRAAEVLAREARSVGINLFFGPVLDLADAPENPIINIRAFHARAEVVAQFGRRVVETVQQYGIACVAKHFPGHGSAQSDSHVEVPELRRALPELEAQDWRPFRAAVEAGVQGIMVGHLQGPGWNRIASLEPAIIQSVLRDQWKYRGVVFTDALDMGAMRRQGSLWEQIMGPLQAGVDVLLMPPQVPLAYQMVLRRLREDEAFRHRVEQAVDRIMALKRWVMKQQPEQSHPLRVYKMVEHPNHVGIAAQVAEQSITLVHRSERFPLPLTKISEVVHLIFTDTEFSGQPLQDFCRELEAFFDTTHILNNPAPEALSSLKTTPSTAAVVSVYFRTFAGHRQEINRKAVVSALKTLRKRGIPVVLFLFGNPWRLQDFPEAAEADAVFLTYSYVAATQKAAFRALCSQIDVRGRLPIPLAPPFADALNVPARRYILKPAEAPLALSKVDHLVHRAMEAKIFPGCVVLAAHRGEILLHRAYGRFDYSPEAPAVRPDTPYDLASLTKVLATTPAIMKLVERGVLSLDQPLADFYPLPVNDPKREITLADLLSHQSGLPAWLPLYEEVDPEKMDSGTIRAAIIRRILNTSLEYAPRSRAVYSDLGFILLGDIVEQVTGVSLDTFCRDHFYRPLGLTSLRFNPPEEMRAAVPPTGTDALRQQPIQGMVNDTNGFVLGGVAGHAGLFGNARDVAAWGQLMIQRGIYECRRMFRHRTVERFCSRYNPRKHARALGWDTPTSGGSTGKYFSSRSIGHLGFTGTSLWVDLKREVVVVLLSNRVHPAAAQNRMNEIRPPLHDAIMEAIPER